MKATDTFHTAPYCHNCAQAVAHKWRHRFATTDVVDSYAACGGGRAPGGMCGALYAATQACPDRADQIVADFKEACGATTCRELKGQLRVPCTRCVDTADALLHCHAGQ